MGLVKAQHSPDRTAPVHPPLADGMAVIGRLGAPEAGERRRAALAVGTQLPAGAQPAAIAALCARLGLEPDGTVREAILTSLMALRSVAAVEGLLPYLRSEDADLRNSVIEVLQAMPRMVVPALEKSLRDPDPDIRIVAVCVLAALSHPEARRLLVAVVERDTDVNVCAGAVDGLVEIGDAEAAGALSRLKARFPGEPCLAFAVDLALDRIGAR